MHTALIREAESPYLCNTQEDKNNVSNDIAANSELALESTLRQLEILSGHDGLAESIISGRYDL
jgi:hypothetical protein